MWGHTPEAALLSHVRPPPASTFLWVSPAPAMKQVGPETPVCQKRVRENDLSSPLTGRGGPFARAVIERILTVQAPPDHGVYLIAYPPTSYPSHPIKPVVNNQWVFSGARHFYKIGQDFNARSACKTRRSMSPRAGTWQWGVESRVAESASYVTLSNLRRRRASYLRSNEISVLSIP